ncbi:MAG TPA: DUF5667 domain-containing protein [Ktedonobacteraceae bacterium]|nr:DUF5667 domain-containing protein [Ktedonobacteraceae bacterium]
MRPLPDRLNDRLEQQIAFWQYAGQPDRLPDAIDDDPEVDELIRLAGHVRSTPFLEVSPAFTDELELRLLQHAKLQPRRSVMVWRNWFPLLSWQPSRTLLLVGVMLLCLLLGTGVLAVAQAASPTSPLYIVKNWEQNVQVSLARSPLDRAELSRQMIHDRLNSLSDLVAPSDAKAYDQALADVDQQMNAIAQIINTLPVGPDRDRLTGELAITRIEVRSALRSVLPRLTIAERLHTTAQLEQLNDTVPHLQSVFIVLPSRSGEQATISVTGDNLAKGARLFVDNQVMASTGTLQNGTDVFVVSWNSTQSPHTIGILNPDGTAAQTTVITQVVPKDSQDDKSSSGHRHDSGGGSGSDSGGGGSSGRGGSWGGGGDTGGGGSWGSGGSGRGSDHAPGGRH